MAAILSRDLHVKSDDVIEPWIETVKVMFNRLDYSQFP